MPAKVYPTDDADIIEEDPGRTRGSYELLYVTEDWNSDALLKFNFRSQVATGVAINSAKVFLYCARKDPTDREARVKKCGNNWDEASVCWNNRPSVGVELGGLGLGAPMWKSLDVTTYVRERHAADGIISFYLTTVRHENTYHGERFYSKEKGGGYEPYLSIDYVPPGPPRTVTCAWCGRTYETYETDSQCPSCGHWEHEIPPGTLKCPLCGYDLGVTGVRVEVIEEGPIFEQLRAAIRALDARITELGDLIETTKKEFNRRIAELEKSISETRDQVNKLKELLGM